MCRRDLATPATILDIEPYFLGFAGGEMALRQLAANHQSGQTLVGFVAGNCGRRWTRPPRSTVAVSQSARISSSLWLI